MKIALLLVAFCAVLCAGSFLLGTVIAHAPVTGPTVAGLFLVIIFGALVGAVLGTFLDET